MVLREVIVPFTCDVQGINMQLSLVNTETKKSVKLDIYSVQECVFYPGTPEPNGVWTLHNKE